MSAVFEPRVRERLSYHGVTVTDDVVTGVCRYLDLLARWNRRINLTAFDLDDPPAHAIDRLIVEPLVAARYIDTNDRVLVDVGSGGGSPALPLKIAVPRLEMTLIEARTRKSAFLREVVRDLALTGVSIETERLEETGHPGVNGRADVVTLRAVRADANLWRGIGALVRPGGRVFWFSEYRPGEPSAAPAGWMAIEKEPAAAAFLRVLMKS